MKETEIYLRELISTQLVELLPRVVESFVENSPNLIGQQFISIREASQRYGLATSSLRSYHKVGAITLRRALKGKRSKLFVSIVELETYLKSNPLPR